MLLLCCYRRSILLPRCEHKTQDDAPYRRVVTIDDSNRDRALESMMSACSNLTHKKWTSSIKLDRHERRWLLTVKVEEIVSCLK